MKLSPNTKFNIIFYTITIPIMPFILLMAFVGILLALIPLIRDQTLRKVENAIYKVVTWRNNLSIVKNAYNKAHLFDYLRESKG